MNYLVVGAGMMGSAIAFDLARSKGVTGVTLADVDPGRAQSVTDRINSPLVRSETVNVEFYDDVVELFRNHQCVIGAVSFRFNFNLSRAAIEAGTHFCDLGGNDEIVRKQRGLDDKARAAGVTIVPNCGLAPGLASILAARGAETFESVESIHLRVGGLPQNPVPPFQYQLVFSIEGLMNEYTGQAAVLREGRLTHVDAMTGVEPIQFPPPFGTLEAFHTSGGASLLPEMFEGRVRELDYKTIRYPGHCDRFKALLDLGFASSEPMSMGTSVMTAREIFLELLKKKLGGDSPDVVLLRVTLIGQRHGTRRTLAYHLVDFHDKNDNITAMMRTTAYPTSVIAQMLGENRISDRGVFTPEVCVPLQPLLQELRARMIEITEEWD